MLIILRCLEHGILIVFLDYSHSELLSDLKVKQGNKPPIKKIRIMKENTVKGIVNLIYQINYH